MASHSLLAERQARVSDLFDDARPLTARSVLASALLGARQPRLPVSHLVAVASLFGISPGAARTCLWRMASNGELTTDDATYALAGQLLERRRRVDAVTRAEHSSTRPWDGTWELAVVPLGRRAAMDRLDLRKAATRLHLAEIREGVWSRPDNLDPGRLPDSRAVIAEQCVQFRGAQSDISVEAVQADFGVALWAQDARRLVAAMEDEIASTEPDDDDIREELSHQFNLSIAAVNRLERDPLLPARCLPDDWPAEHLRTTYRRFNDAFQQSMSHALTS